MKPAGITLPPGYRGSVTNVKPQLSSSQAESVVCPGTSHNTRFCDHLPFISNESLLLYNVISIVCRGPLFLANFQQAIFLPNHIVRWVGDATISSPFPSFPWTPRTVSSTNTKRNPKPPTTPVQQPTLQILKPSRTSVPHHCFIYSWIGASYPIELTAYVAIA